MRFILLCGAVFAATAVLHVPAGAQHAPAPDPLVARGRYLVAIGACNDCHTPGWRDSGGNVAPAKWMTGSQVGLRQAWGTDYPANVRQRFHQITEDQWLFAVRTRGGPRMQWHDLRRLTLQDQRAIYRFVRSLGNSTARIPEDIGPEQEPATSYIDLRLHTPAPK